MFYTGNLIFIEVVTIVIPEDRDPDSSHIIVERVRGDDIIPSSTTLIDTTTLADQVVIADISPTPRDCMVGIDPTDELLITLGIIETLGSMVKDNPRNLFDLSIGQ